MESVYKNNSSNNNITLLIHVGTLLTGWCTRLLPVLCVCVSDVLEQIVKMEYRIVALIQAANHSNTLHIAHTRDNYLH